MNVILSGIALDNEVREAVVVSKPHRSCDVSGEPGDESIMSVICFSSGVIRTYRAK